MPHFRSFGELCVELESKAKETFVHHWEDPTSSSQLPDSSRPKSRDFPGRRGEEICPKYLYRGEAGEYPSSSPSRSRITTTFDEAELALLDELTSMAAWCWRLRTTDAFRSVGWPQPYGFPTHALDVTSNPRVALHFAADSRTNPPVRVVYRVDLEAIEPKVYGPGGQPTPLSIAGIGREGCERAIRQQAFVLCDNDPGTPLDFRNSEHLRGHVKRFTVDAGDARDFVKPELLDARSDGYASWPLAVVRSFKAARQQPLSRKIAEWLVARIPLYEQTPFTVYYNAQGVGSRLGLSSPADAAASDGRSYEAKPDAVIDELTSPEMAAPSALLFGTATGGTPHTERQFRPGDEYEIQWRYGFPPPRVGRAFERVVIR